MFNQINQIITQTTQNTSIFFILNIFSFWCTRMKIVHFCIINITNWNPKDLILWTLITKYIWSIQRIIKLLLYCSKVCLNLVIRNNRQFLNLAVWPSNLNFVIFIFESDFFPLVIYSLLMTCIFFSYIYLNFDFDVQPIIFNHHNFWK